MELGTDKHCVIRLSLLTLLLPFLSSEGVQAHALGTRKWGGYRRFHANSSLVGQPVPCTSDEKICFRYNLMFYPKWDKCKSVGSFCDLRANKEKFGNGSGHISASCPEYDDPCPGYRMAYDNRCYPESMVRDTICQCDARPIRHFLRGVECQCNPRSPVQVEQPAQDGHCVIPDFNFPIEDYSLVVDYKVSDDGNLISDEKCSTDQFACFSEGKVWVAEGRGCFKLLERGPCAEDHLVALDRQAAAEQRVEAVCVHKEGGCPRGQIRMLVDGQCHDKRKIDITTTGVLFRSVFGLFAVAPPGPYYSFSPLTLLTKPNICYVRISYYSYHGGENYHVSPPFCGANDRSLCFLYEVEDKPPQRSEDE